MFEDIQNALPEQWKGLFRFLIFPISWIPDAQNYLWSLSWNSDYGFALFFKRIFLVLPAVAIVLGLWCTMFAIYTLAFRKDRVKLMGAMLVSWWDVFRCTWLFWAGMGKFLWMAFGSLWGVLRLVVGVIIELAREIFDLPFVLTGNITRNLRQPGVPWIAFVLTIFWCLLEALIFTYVLTPTISEILSDLVGVESHTLLGITLFLMLFFMIAGSFACMHVLLDAIDKKEKRTIIQMIGVEIFVMFVEVFFLYRELVDALTPWVAQQTGFQMGIVSVILGASAGWGGIRGMVWLLFGRFGTPTLLAIIARQRLVDEPAEAKPGPDANERASVIINKIKSEQGWFQTKAEILLSAAVLPVFQVIAAGFNFGFVLVLGKPVFNIPFNNLADIKETKNLITSGIEQ
jgi:hypothetical protein